MLTSIILKHFLYHVFIINVLCFSRGLAVNASQEKDVLPVAKNAYASLGITKEFGKTTIPFSTSLPMVGENSILGKQMLAQTENYLREFRHFVTPSHSQQERNILRHVKNSISPLKSPLVLGLVGMDALFSIRPHIQKRECLLLFPIEEFVQRKEKYQNVIYFRPSQEKELNALSNYCIDTMHRESVAILYEESIWGKGLLGSLQKTLSRHNITPVAVAPYPQGTVEVEQAIKTIAKAAPNAIFCLAHPRAAYTFISNGLNAGMHECLFLGLSQLNVIQHQLSTSRGPDIAVTSVVPNIAKSTFQLATDYKKATETFLSFRDDSVFYLETFINLSLFEYCTSGLPEPITIERIIQRLESLKNFDFKGLTLSFDPADRSLSSALWINPGEGQEWIVCQ